MTHKDGLLICKEGKKEETLEMVYDSGFGAVIEVEEASKELKTSTLNNYSLLLVQDSVKLNSNL